MDTWALLRSEIKLEIAIPEATTRGVSRWLRKRQGRATSLRDWGSGGGKGYSNGALDWFN